MHKTENNTYEVYEMFVFFFFFFLGGSTGFELKTSYLLGRHSTAWAMPPALIALVI
jgi:hypothetical protein